MDDTKSFTKNEKELEALIQTIKNTKLGYRHGIWHRNICQADNESGENENNGKNRTVKLEKN